MGFFDNISSRQRKQTNAPAPRLTSASQKTSQNRAPQERQAESVDIHTTGQTSSSLRATYIPSAPIPNAQAFVTSDNSFNAGASNYVQSVMKKKQAMDAQKAEAFDQAAKAQANARKAAEAPRTKSNDGWPQLPAYLDIPGRDITSPAYHAMLAHLGVNGGFFVVLDRDFDQTLDSLVKAHKVEKRHINLAGRKVCEEMNKFLSEQWDMFISVLYVWDASIDEGAFRFTYPQSKDERIKWAEQVKGRYWSKDDWNEWNEEKKSLGIS